jgi:hypothetical protein
LMYIGARSERPQEYQTRRSRATITRLTGKANETSWPDVVASFNFLTISKMLIPLAFIPDVINEVSNESLGSYFPIPV